MVEFGAWSHRGNAPSSSAPKYIQSLAATASQPCTYVAEYGGGAVSAPHVPPAHSLTHVHHTTKFRATHHTTTRCAHTHTHALLSSGTGRVHAGHQRFTRGQDHPRLSTQQHPQPGTRWQLSMQQKQPQWWWRQQQHLALLARLQVSLHTSANHHPGSRIQGAVVLAHTGTKPLVQGRVPWGVHNAMAPAWVLQGPSAVFITTPMNVHATHSLSPTCRWSPA